MSSPHSVLRSWEADLAGLPYGCCLLPQMAGLICSTILQTESGFSQSWAVRWWLPPVAVRPAIAFAQSHLALSKLLIL